MFLPHAALLIAASLAPPASAAPAPPAAPTTAPATTATPVAAPAAVLPAVMAWAPPPGAGARAEHANLFTLVDYFDQGQRLALSYLDGLAPEARGRFRTADLAPACVRVTCERDGGHSIVFSTGVLVNGGRHVVTAGHGVGELDEPGATLSVVMTDGRQLPARLVRRSALDSQDEDWAVLELTNVPSGAVSVAVGAARPGALAFIMGYPERVGLGADGHATSALSAEPLALDPLLFVARVPLSAGSELEPLAGALPLSGASGSPVFDENGTLVGVLVAIGRLAYPDGLRHVYRVSMSAEFRAALGT